MNAWATLLNGRTIKENGGGTAVVQATQDNSEAVLEIWKCVWSTKTLVAWIFQHD